MDAEPLRAALLAWYDAQARELPWRVGPLRRRAGARPNPYRVWLSEVMLQQTTVAHAIPYFLEFTRRWPTVRALAAAPEAEVMAAWAGLGYYARARNLIACARAVAREHGGRFPEAEADLRALPGLGPYTAAAVAAIAFDQSANVVDGNVERVVARLFAVEAALPVARPELKRLAATLVPWRRPGDWAQAVMDLGAVVCRPRSPLCERCPVAGWCVARARGEPERYPRKAGKAARPRRMGQVYVLTSESRVAVVRRPATGLLGGMLGLPTSEWAETSPPLRPPCSADWREAGRVAHGFTHFSLDLRVWTAERAECLSAFEWLPVIQARRSLPSVFLKALRRGLQPTVSNDPVSVASRAKPSKSASSFR